MKKLKFSIIIVLLTLNGFAQKNCEYQIDKKRILENINLDSFLTEFQNEQFVVDNDKKSIPKHVKKELDCIASEFSIANPKEEYQAGCNVEKDKPKRQLIFLAKSKDILILTYATGGIGSSTHFLFIKYDSEKIIDLWTGVGMGIIKHKSLKEISKYISSQRDREWGLNTNIVSI
ncbi:hypothetical protein [Tenacibaculum halocynthiae]|uniref:hypothetical protein n=1 Tax=Tenacibaculum halocynthiae TaxID=1254437 RepID=UPI0038936943